LILRFGGGRWRASPGSYSRVSPNPSTPLTPGKHRVAPKELTAGALAVRTPAVCRAFGTTSNKVGGGCLFLTAQGPKKRRLNASGGDAQRGHARSLLGERHGWGSARPSTSDQGKFSVEGLAGEGSDEGSNRVTASTITPVWLGLDVTRNRASLNHL
jgi:hypothetical protein